MCDVSHIPLVRAIVYSDLSNDFYASNRNADLGLLLIGAGQERSSLERTTEAEVQNVTTVPPTASRQRLQTTIDLVELL